MSVLIKGAKVPKSCAECDFIEYDDEYEYEYWCPIIRINVEEYTAEKYAGCPLVEIPPHGRLIDADKLEYNSIGCWAPDEVRPPQDDTEWLISKYDIDEETPTVIESEDE